MKINHSCDLCEVRLLLTDAYKNLICAYTFHLRRKRIYLNKSRLKVLLKVRPASSYNDAKWNVGDGCCWHAQDGLCHRTKNQITGLMLCSPTHGTRRAAYRCLSHRLIELQLHSQSVAPSCRPESQRWPSRTLPKSTALTWRWNV